MEFLPVWPFPVNTLFFFGFLLFCGALGGYVAHRWPWIPSITGFMVVGLFAGPNVLGLISPEALAQSRIVVDVALALILYRLGLSLDIKRFINDRSLVLISLTESALTFVAVWIASNVIFAFATPGPELGETNIAWQAHIGGLVAGFLLLPIFLQQPGR